MSRAHERAYEKRELRLEKMRHQIASGDEWSAYRPLRRRFRSFGDGVTNTSSRP